HLHDHDVGDDEAGGRRPSAVERRGAGAEGCHGHDDAVARDLRERSSGPGRRRLARERAQGRPGAHQREGRDPGRRPSGRARRGRARPRPRQGGGGEGLRPGVGVNGRLAGAVGLVIGLVIALGVTARAADVQSLEQRARGFYQLLEKGEREKAKSEGAALEHDLAAAREEIDKTKDRMRADLEEGEDEPRQAVQDPRLRQLEIQSLIIDYHLAWVRYQNAQLVDDPARKNTLLENAADGFSKFTSMKEVSDVYAESLYGRGLAYLDLGNYKSARDDLRAAAALPRTAEKAKAALAEVDRRESGKPAPPPQDSDQMLLDRLANGLPRASADPAAEKDVTALARGLTARGGDWPGKVQGVVTQKLGDGTPAGVKSSYGLFLLGQLAIDRGRCADVATLAATGAGVKAGGRARWRPELLFLYGGCLLNAGKSADAAGVFEELVRDFPEAPRAPEAAYYRIRALDVARGTDPARGAAFEDALTTYLAHYPKADGVAEARWMLGDLYRS